MEGYPYSSPIILTDAIFAAYNDGLQTGSSLKQTGYWLAEEAVSRDLNTFLLPTVVTGTYSYSPYIMLDHAYVREIKQAWFLDSDGLVYYTVTGSFNTYLRLQSDTYGVVDVDYLGASCGACTAKYPYQIKIAYEAGLVSGTSYQPNVLLALTQGASMFINILQGWGNEGVDNIGIVRFSNQQYSEQRMALINTVYGNSTKAQLIHKQLDGLRKRRAVGI